MRHDIYLHHQHQLIYFTIFTFLADYILKKYNMVRITMKLLRTPVIKFRKGGLGQTSSAARAPASAPDASPVRSSAARCVFSRTQTAAPMSTCSIPDIDLPLKYRRAPLSQEEIDKINGGGII